MIIHDITRLIVPLPKKKELPVTRSKGCLVEKFYVSLKRMPEAAFSAHI